MNERLTRRTARRGTRVKVTFKDGRPALVGTLVGWGTQVIDVAPDYACDRVQWPWKRHSVWVGLVAAVVEL